MPYAVLLSEETTADAPAAPSLHTEQHTHTHTQLSEHDKEAEVGRGAGRKGRGRRMHIEIWVCVSIHHSWEMIDYIKHTLLLLPKQDQGA